MAIIITCALMGQCNADNYHHLVVIKTEQRATHVKIIVHE